MRFSQFVLVFATLSTTAARSAMAQQPEPAGYVTAADGARLYYEQFGSGPQTILVPGRLFLSASLRQLGDRYRVVTYDMRDRGRSDAIDDSTRITIQADVSDLEAMRRHVGAERVALIGYSYLGMMVMLYALEHPEHVTRVVQLGPVPLQWDTRFATSVVDRSATGADPAARRRLDSLRRVPNIDQRVLCEAAWAVDRFGLVGDPARVDRAGGSQCDMATEWPAHFRRHLDAQFATIQQMHHAWSEFAGMRIPVLTIHGTRDRNAPYGAGREWAMRLPNARLITIAGGAHHSFSEYPDLVWPAVRTFLDGSWPTTAERITRLEP